jgi:hypothetical protein
MKRPASPARLERQCLLVALLSALVACGEVPAPTPLEPAGHTRAQVQDPSQIGIAIVGLVHGWDDATVQRVAGYARNAGATWVREIINWHQIMPNAIATSSEDANWNQDMRRDHHRRYAILRNAGLHIFVTLQGTPWYGCYPGATCDWKTAPQLGVWGDFVREIVREYPEVEAWGIYNEPSDPGQWQTGMGIWDPPYYGDRLMAYWKTVYWGGAAIRTWAPGKLVVAVEQGTGDGVWLRSVLANAGSVIDVISLHEYGTSGGAENDVRNADQIARSIRSGGWPIWVTEAGNVANGAFPNDEQQASHLTRLFQRQFSTNIVNWKKTFPWHLWKPQGSADGLELIRDIDNNPPTFRLAYRCMTQLANYLPLDPACTWTSECDAYMTSVDPNCPGYPAGISPGPGCGNSPCELRSAPNAEPKKRSPRRAHDGPRERAISEGPAVPLSLGKTLAVRSAGAPTSEVRNR